MAGLSRAMRKGMRAGGSMWAICLLLAAGSAMAARLLLDEQPIVELEAPR